MLYLVLFIVVGKNIKLRVYRATPCILGCLLINILIHRKREALHVESLQPLKNFQPNKQSVGAKFVCYSPK